jgi:hypothetical protein
MKIIPFILLSILMTACGNSVKNQPKSSKSKKPSAKKEKITWNQNTLTLVSSHTTGDQYSGYARMIQLQDGSLICVYEADGDIAAVRSKNNGKSWSDTTLVAKKKPGIKMSTPSILELQDHSLLVSYNPRPLKPYNPSKKFAVMTKKSFDEGKSWKDKRVIYKRGYRPQNGCFEPVAVQLPDGEIQLFFSNTAVYHNGDQNISLLRSKDDGLTWTKKLEIASYRKGSRDGMPVSIVLPKAKQVVFSIENNGGKNFKPYIIRNSFADNWSNPVLANSPYRSYALKSKIKPSVYAGAPYLVKLKSGKTLLSWQGTTFRKNNDLSSAEMKVAIGNKKAKDFRDMTTPFDIPPDKNGLWNSLAVLNDSIIIAMTSTNAYSKNNHTEVWMVRGKLVHN